jgi:DNA-binding CsgD family transcriptional regulator
MADGVQQYADYYGAIDPRRRLSENMPVGDVFACNQHFSEAVVARDEFYQDFLIPHGQRYVLIAKVLSDDRRDQVIGLMREAGNKPFDQADVDEARRLVGHLGRASRMGSQTAQLRTGAAFEAQAARASAFALIGLDAAGQVVYANAQAELLLRGADCLLARNGGIGAVFGDDELRLHRGVREVRETGCGQSLVLAGQRSGHQSLVLNIAPVPGSGVLITARPRLQPPALSPNALFQAFGLTPAESAAALALCEGKTPEEHAQALGLSMSTVRTQLRAVFEKTQTRRQSETVGLLMGMPPADD